MDEDDEYEVKRFIKKFKKEEFMLEKYYPDYVKNSFYNLPEIEDVNVLINNVDYLTKWYDVYFVLLLATEEDLKIRLNRDKFAYQSFSVESSLAQQKQYQKEFMNLAKMNTGIKVYEIENDNLPRTVNTIESIILGGFLD